MQPRVSLTRTSLTLAASVAAAACSAGLGSPSGPGIGSAAGPEDSTGDGDGQPGSGDPAAPSFSGLPCDVSQLLARHCVSCHGGTPIGGAHVSLLAAGDLAAPSPTRAGDNVAEEALARMQSRGADRMPPGGGALSAEEIAKFESWIDQGLPEGECGSLADAGVAQPDPAFNGPTVCTSDELWTLGNEESPLMRPGHACVDCHTQEDEGPSFSLAGTVFPTGHEPDDCAGADGRAAEIVVEVTDADGEVVTMRANRSGNFFSETEVRFPITARVLHDGRTRTMLTAVESGDCNTCHTTDGRDNAPGRIALP